MNDQLITHMIDRVDNRFYGKYRAIVVENADPENRGRLRLKVPSVLGETVITGWALPCVPYGGSPEQGFLFIPEIDAGVWVEFEAGLLEYPIWVGTFWCSPGGNSELPKPSGADGSPESDVQSPPTRKIIRTVQGHTLQFEDADGNEQIILVEGKHNHIVLLNADGISLTDGVNNSTIILNGDGIAVTDGVNSNTVVLNAEGIAITDGVNSHAVILNGDGIDIMAGDSSGNHVAMTSSGITIESSMDITLKGNNITIKATAETKIEATGNTTIKGALVDINP
jgi:hypothetical protein